MSGRPSATATARAAWIMSFHLEVMSVRRLTMLEPSTKVRSPAPATYGSSVPMM